MPAFDVYVEVMLTMRYRVHDAATPDEAETIAEGLAEEGIKGKVIEREILPGAAELVNEDEYDADQNPSDPYEEDDEEQ
jgi:hypothetical protein